MRRWMPYNAIESSESFHIWFEGAVTISRAGVQVLFAILKVRGISIGSTRYLTLRPERFGLEIG